MVNWLGVRRRALAARRRLSPSSRPGQSAPPPPGGPPNPPAWLGIGAQRSGTTWMLDLLRQHPRVGTPGRKELHLLYDGLEQGWDDARRDAYLALFAGQPRKKLGEWTPYYLRAPWAAVAAQTVLGPDVPIWVILRDPVERCESGVRHALEIRKQPFAIGGIRSMMSDSIYTGMYASQLDTWAAVFGKERITVLQYEAVRDDPQAAVDRLWGQLGLDSQPLRRVERPSGSSTRTETWSVDVLPGFRDQLRVQYEREVDVLVDEWGIDRSLWRNFV